MKRVAYLMVLCALALAPSARSQAPNEAPRVLIASEGGDFKNAVVANVATFLENRGLASKQIELKQLTKEPVENYDALVVVNTIWAWRLRGSVRKFLAPLNEEQKKRVILVSTAGDEEWQTKEKGVHAITAASKTPRIDTVTTFVTNRLDAILTSR